MTIEFSHWPQNYGKSFQVTKILGLGGVDGLPQFEEMGFLL